MCIVIINDMKTEAQIISDFCEDRLPLATARLPEEYYYQSLSFCVIDAIFSINARYASVQNTVNHYAAYSNKPCFRTDKLRLPPLARQESIETFIKTTERFKHADYHSLATDVLRNRQRTSSRNGILKATATIQFAKVLRKYGVNYFQDIKRIQSDTLFEKEILKIKGQGSGISLKYFFMLAGNDSLVKPDRWILNFIRSAIGRTLQPDIATDLIIKSSKLLTIKHPHITPRLLDYEIWKYQRSLK